ERRPSPAAAQGPVWCAAPAERQHGHHELRRGRPEGEAARSHARQEGRVDIRAGEKGWHPRIPNPRHERHADRWGADEVAGGNDDHISTLWTHDSPTILNSTASFSKLINSSWTSSDSESRF